MTIGANSRAAQARAGAFVDRLSALRFPDSFNPYRDHCPNCDLPDGPAIRRRNLERALAAALRRGVHSLWVARDLGYNGGRRTGLAMTDDLRLSAHGAMLEAAGLERATRGEPVIETTARVVWRAIDGIGGAVWLWNVFPLHPHRPRQPFSNRCHTPAERRAAAPLLDWLLAALRPERLVAVGRDAEQALGERGLSATYVRHPAMAGQPEFLAGMGRIYGRKL